MALNIVSLIALAFSLGGNVLINYQKRMGFVVWIASNLLWIAVNLLGTPNWSQIAMFIVYIALNVQGMLKWQGK